MKKRILFVIINMNVGGVEKSLLNLLKILSPQENQIRILMLEKKGKLLKEIPTWVEIDTLLHYEKIKFIFNNPPKKVMLNYLKDYQFINFFYFSFIFMICKIKGDRSLLLKKLLSDCPDYQEIYDEVIAYASPMELIDYYVVNKVKANKKIAWIHFDVTKIKIEKNFFNKIYGQFDKIRIVSNDTKNKFDKIFPTLKSKNEVVYNVILSNEIKKLSNEKGFDDYYSGLRLLTVGRLSEEKGQDLIIRALKLIIDQGIDAKLYLVGEGNFYNYCKNLVKDLKLENKVVFLGMKKNPYPYMRECDIYIQPSRYEAYCTTISEVLIFNKKIVATNFNSIDEQLREVESKNKYICDFKPEEIAKGILEIL